ncbi:MAG: hypothetical protein MUW56_05805 [Chryseobacterium sp.]|uniref:hypothetical protein n=1 Tax=Chryseobacterium sp. TaxID=1871047 RepID=UPI0025C2B9E2|nr:hypothetical protein [Chryseobacterium sp.]MCJ7933148.1 hypothetical protein [Chryseobacterium sp.]
MKLIIIVLSVFTLTNCTKARDNRKLLCNDFKIGKFQLINNQSKRKYLIERTKDFQIEQTFDLITNQKIKKDRYYKISWKNDCEYNLIVDTSKGEHDEFDTYINSIGGYNCLIAKIENKCAIVQTKVENEISESSICKIE